MKVLIGNNNKGKIKGAKQAFYDLTRETFYGINRFYKL